MRNRRWLFVVLAFLVVVVLGFAIPLSRDIVGGWLSDEPFHDGRPLRYWLRIVRAGDAQQRARAAHVLGQLGAHSADVLPALSEALGDASYIVRRNAAEAIGRIGPAARDTAPALIRVLHDADARVRWRAAQAVGEIQPEPAAAVPALLALAAHDPDVPTRAAAMISLGNLGAAAEPAIPLLVDTLKRPADNNGDLAGSAREALRRIGVAAVPALIATCKHENARARAGAAQTLADMGEPARAAIGTLKTLLEDAADPVRVHAAAALWKLDGQVDNTVAVLAAVLRSSDGHAKADAMVALGQMGAKAAAAVVPLQDSLREKNHALRRTAAQTLAKIGSPAQPALAALHALARDDEEPDVQRAAADAIEAIRKK